MVSMQIRNLCTSSVSVGFHLRFIFLWTMMTCTRGAFVCLNRNGRSSSSLDFKLTVGKHRKYVSNLSATRPDKEVNDDGNNRNGNNDKNDESTTLSRRDLLSSSIMAFSCSSMTMLPIEPAAATLATFPCEKFQNTYHLMRAGESLLEEEGIYSTNPLFLTSSDSALSENGKKQLEKVVNQIKESDQQVTLIKFSLAAHSIASCTFIADRLKLGGDRRLQEFTYMDPRAVGKWDGLPISEVEGAIWTMDATEAGPNGIGGQPPATDDSTPNETLAIQVTRLRQLISVLDTSFSGDSILIIFPDGTGPALLSCMIGGIPLNRVHELNYEPGEIRFNVTKSRALAMLPSEPQQAYINKLEKGKEQLKFLRENEGSIQNVNEQRYEAERQALEAEQAAIDRAKKDARDKVISREKEKRLKARGVTSPTMNDAQPNLGSTVGGSITVIGGIGALLASTLLGNTTTSEILNESGSDSLPSTSKEEKVNEGENNVPENSKSSLFADDSVIVNGKNSNNPPSSELVIDQTTERSDDVDKRDDTSLFSDEDHVETITQEQTELSKKLFNEDDDANTSSDRKRGETELFDGYDDYGDGSDAWLQMIQDVMVNDEESTSGQESILDDDEPFQ